MEKETWVGGTFLWVAKSKGCPPHAEKWEGDPFLFLSCLCWLEQLQKNLPAVGFALEVKVCACQPKL